MTLAILPTLMVEVGEQTFALPLGCVNEIFHLDLKKANMVDGQLTIIVREKAIPLFYLHKWLIRGANKRSRQDTGHVVIVQIGTQQIGFVVDSLIGQEEVVIKPLDNLLQGTPAWPVRRLPVMAESLLFWMCRVCSKHMRVDINSSGPRS